MAENNGKKRTLRVDEVCEILGCSDSLVYELAQRQELAAFRIGLGARRGGLRILAASVDDFISRRCEQFKDECLGLEKASTIPAVPTNPAEILRGNKKPGRLKT